jgi:glyoxylase-like metal-dependent hydrolase (beta-lactamase superfamily II)
MQPLNVEPLTNRLALVHGTNEGVFPHSHSILVLGEEVVLIDTGCGIETLNLLKSEYRVDYVINSHTHPDHSAGNWVLEGRPIYVPREGFDTAGDATALGSRFAGGDNVEAFRQFVTGAMGFRDCRPTGSYGHRKVFDFGGVTLETIHTPGHTRDHCCFLEPAEGILFSFDYDLTPFPWYGHAESSLVEFKESLAKLLALSPRLVVSAHRGVVSDDISGEFDRYRRRIDRRDDTLLSMLDTAAAIDQLVKRAPIYGSFPYAESLLRYWEARMIEKHLAQLELEGRVERRGHLFIRS